MRKKSVEHVLCCSTYQGLRIALTSKTATRSPRRMYFDTHTGLMPNISIWLTT